MNIEELDAGNDSQNALPDDAQAPEQVVQDVFDKEDLVDENAESDATITSPEGEGEKPTDEGQDKTEEKPEEKAEKPAEKPVNRRSERIQELNTRAQKAEAEAKRLQKRVTSLEGAKAPDPDDFEKDSEFDQARLEHEAKQRHRIEAELNLEDAKSESEEIAEEQGVINSQEWADKCTAFAKDTPDYSAVMSATNIQMNKEVLDGIMELDNGPKIAYHLAKNPAKAAEIHAMSPVMAAMEIGKIGAGLTSVTAKPKRVSNAPEPLKPLDGSQGAGEVDFSKLEGPDFAAAWDKELGK